ncbi:MAG: penicillin acylase family protein [Pseudomonadota bacterium]
MIRNEAGTPRLKGDKYEDVVRELGAAHATDRAAQMAMMRIIGQGRTTLCLADEEPLLKIDRFFRWLGLQRGAAEEIKMLGERERKIIEAYCEGVNSTMATRRKPMPFRVWKYRWEPWKPEDMVLLVRMMAWVGLVSGQVNAEKAIIELVRAGTSGEKLAALLDPHLEGCDFDLMKQITMVGRLIPEAIAAGKKAGGLSASNNWAVSGSKTESGSPILANDPHLEVNRLPPVWYEVIAQMGDDYLMGVTVPGLPAVVIGRNSSLAWGITYTEADTTDFFVEECRDGKYKRDGEWKDFEVIKETITRRGGGTEEVTVYKNEHGLLEGDPHKEGKYLCLAWAGFHKSFADIMGAMLDINFGKSVEDGLKAVQGFHYPSLNWVFADRDGNIGYRMAGLFPKRREGWSGLYPVDGTDSANDWQGWVSQDDLPEVVNPAEGFFSTANQDLSALGGTRVQNLPMTDYRGDRIKQILGKKDKLGCEDMQAIQLDIYSLKAQRFVPLFLDVMPEGEQAALLKDWNFEYDPQSRAASLFEALYEKALFAVFCRGSGSIPEQMLEHLREETSAFLNLEVYADKVLLSEDSIWFDGGKRDDILKEAFSGLEAGPPPAWGELNRMTMVNIFYGGKLPKFLGVDKGPFAVPGGSSTVRQGSVYRDADRDTTFCPSYRFVTDLGTDEARTILPGGPSEKSISKYYKSDLASWLTGKYKKITGKGS